jgi:hypothetical protein
MGKLEANRYRGNLLKDDFSVSTISDSDCELVRLLESSKTQGSRCSRVYSHNL